MAISYNGLWKLLIDKNKKKTDLIENIGISSSTLAKMSKGDEVSMTPSNPKWENMIKRQSELYDRSGDDRQICSKAV